MKETLRAVLPRPAMETARSLQRAGRRARSMLTPVPDGAAGSLQCRIAYNEFGGYCVPQSSSYRPAAQSVLNGKVWERGTLEYMIDMVGSGDIVHAGTYFGDFLPALSDASAHGARIWAFEPHPEHYRCTRITAILNDLDNVVLYNAGLAESRGSIPMTAYDEAGRALGGGSRLVGPGLDPGVGRTIDVEALPLDDVLPTDRNVSIIQLDVEGFEQAAITGAMRTIERCRPTLILESLPDADWLAENVLALGYRVDRELDLNTVLRPTANGHPPV